MTEISLTQYGLMAERHWRQFRPKMVRRLEAQGKLEAALFEVGAASENEKNRTLSPGEHPKRPELAR